MPIIVRLDDVVEAMERPQEWSAYLNPDTGEIVSIPDADSGYAEDDDVDPDDLRDWERDIVVEAQRVRDSNVWLSLPDSFDIHEWQIMRDFTDETDEPARRELLNAIHGPGAFRMFRATTERLGLRDKWFAYRDAAVRLIAKEWLTENGIAFIDTSDTASADA